MNSENFKTRIAILTSLFLSIIFLWLHPLLSTDVYRYVWDGGLMVHGINPYTITPLQAFPAEFYEPKLFTNMSWKDQYTVYPPFAQIIFAISYLFYKMFGIWGAKIVFSLPLLFLFAFFYKKISNKYFLILILNPFVLFEAFNGAHIDFWMIFFVVLSIYSFQKGKMSASALMLGLAILTKLWPLLLLPYFVYELYKKSFKQSLFYLFTSLALVFIFYIPIISDLPFLVSRYSAWVSLMEYNSGFYGLINIFLPTLSHKACLLLTILLLAVNLFYNKLSTNTLLIAVVTFFAFSSVVYPWYVAIIFFLVIYSARYSEDKFIDLNIFGIILFQFFAFTAYISEYTQLSWEHINLIINTIKIFEYSTVYSLIAYIFYVNYRFNITKKIISKDSYSHKNVLAVMPVYNEDCTLLSVISTLKNAGLKNIFVGVDCNTTDKSVEILKENHIAYQISDKTGFDESLNKVVKLIQTEFPSTTHVLFLDAGNKYSEETYRKMLDSIDGSDLILGNRKNGRDKMFWHQKLGTYIVLIPIWIMFLRKIKDISPLRVIKLDLLLSLNMQPAKYRYTTEMLVKTLSLGKTVKEVDVVLQERIGKSKISSNPRNSLRAGRDMLSAMRFVFFK